MAAAAPAGAGLSMATSMIGGAVAQQNADALARQLRLIGEIEADDHRRATRRLLAAQQVAFAAAGVDTGSGTPLDVLGDAVAERELEALRIKFGRRSEAKAARIAGNAAHLQSIAQGGQTILGAVADYNRNKQGGKNKQDD